MIYAMKFFKNYIKQRCIRYNIQTPLLRIAEFKRVLHQKLQLNSGQKPERSVATSAQSGLYRLQNKKILKFQTTMEVLNIHNA